MGQKRPGLRHTSSRRLKGTRTPGFADTHDAVPRSARPDTDVYNVNFLRIKKIDRDFANSLIKIVGDAQAVKMGEPWPSSELKELGNHASNFDWFTS